MRQGCAHYHACQAPVGHKPAHKQAQLPSSRIPRTSNDVDNVDPAEAGVALDLVKGHGDRHNKGRVGKVHQRDDVCPRAVDGAHGAEERKPEYRSLMKPAQSERLNSAGVSTGSPLCGTRAGWNDDGKGTVPSREQQDPQPPPPTRLVSFFFLFWLDP